MRFSILAISVVLGLVLVSWGCGSDDDGTTTTPPPTVTATAAASAVGFSMEFEGAGSGDTLGFELVPGTAVFRLRHDGASEFVVNLVDSNGQRHANLPKTQGSYDGSKRAHITLAGTYAMKVFADGNWTISVEQ